MQMYKHIIPVTNYLLVAFLATFPILRASMQSNPDLDQLERFLQRTQGPIGVLTTGTGSAIPYSVANNTLNTRLIYNEFFMGSIYHLVQERIPERIVHTKGTGAFGHFTVTNNISAICRAKVFSEDGKKTPIAVRFSQIMGEEGSSDTARDGRGFAVRFYTEDGNFDLVGVSLPIFAVNDPILFTGFVHSQKRNPATNLRDANMFWDFLTLNPSCFNFILHIFGDSGIPDGYRHMPGHGLHTFQVENEKGEIYFIKFHMVPESGIKTLSTEQARKIEEVDFDYSTRDLYRAIEFGNFPVWTLNIQVLTLEDVNKMGSAAFDITRILSVDEYPLVPVGKFVLNRNPLNNFAEVEQMALSPTHLVDGIIGAPDVMFQTRSFAYRSSQSYRLGPNYNRIRVNCPYQTVRPLDYTRDGPPPLLDNGKDIPNYYPNSFNGPVPYFDTNRLPVINIKEVRSNNFDQANDLYVNMSSGARNRLIENILSSIRPAVRFIQQRAIEIFKTINPDLGRRVEQGLFSNRTI